MATAPVPSKSAKGAAARISVLAPRRGAGRRRIPPATLPPGAAVTVAPHVRRDPRGTIGREAASQ
jgi:hypothetical protein